MHYLLTFNPSTGAIEIAGPFPTENEAAIAGAAWQKANGDNPCWNTLATDSAVSITVATAHQFRLRHGVRV